MAKLNPTALNAPQQTKKTSFLEGQKLAKQKAYEKQSRRKKIKLDQLCVFTQQLSAMLEAGLPLVSALEAQEEQTENPVFRIIIRNVRSEVSAGRSCSDACTDYPNAFPNLFVSMVEAASFAILRDSGQDLDLFRRHGQAHAPGKGAMTYPGRDRHCCFAGQRPPRCGDSVFAEMFSSFGPHPKATKSLLISANSKSTSFSSSSASLDHLAAQEIHPRPGARSQR